jgi:hypothetical protein
VWGRAIEPNTELTKHHVCSNGPQTITGISNASAPQAQEQTARIKALAIDGLTVDEVSIRAASESNGLPLVSLLSTPEVCRVMFTLRPTPRSEIGVELWMPTGEWNSRFLGTGNGGRTGEISPLPFISGTSMGFAVANTDMGTTLDPLEMTGDAERIRDFGGRATHLMTIYCKRIIEEFYRRPLEHSYFVGLSAGGQQALREAQVYPADYDGIVAICPANNRVRLHTPRLYGSGRRSPPTATRLSARSWRQQSPGVAAAVSFLSTEDAAFITGALLPVDGGFLAAGALES